MDDTVRTMHSVRVRRGGPLITIEFDGEGFLYKMARMMTAALLQAGQGKVSRAEIRQRLANNPRLIASSREVAPAAGLFLFRVRY